MDRAMERLLPTTDLTDEQKHSLEDILDAAVDWQQGNASVGSVMELGLVPDHKGNPSPGRSRFVAAWLMRRDPRVTALHALQDYVNTANHSRSKQGYFYDQREREQHRAAVLYLRNKAEHERNAA